MDNFNGLEATTMALQIETLVRRSRPSPFILFTRPRLYEASISFVVLFNRPPLFKGHFFFLVAVPRF